MPVLNGKLECGSAVYTFFDGDAEELLRQPGGSTACDSVILKPRGKERQGAWLKTAKDRFSQKMASVPKPKEPPSPVDAPATVTVYPGVGVRPTRGASTASSAPTKGAEARRLK